MKKRLISLLTCISLLCVYTTAFAELGGLKDPSVKAKYILEYMDYTQAAKTATSSMPNMIDMAGMFMSNTAIPIVEPATKPNPDTIAVNDTFLVGIKLKDLNAVTEAAQGLDALTFVLNYDPTYLTLTETDFNTMTTNSKNRLGSTNQGSILASPNSFSTQYAYDANGGSINTTDGKVVMFIKDTDGTKAPGYKGVEEQYLGVLKFTVKAIPDGRKLSRMIKISDDKSEFTASFGASGSTGSYCGTGSRRY